MYKNNLIMKYTEWNSYNSNLAENEGWNIYDSFGSSDGDYQIQMNDYVNKFDDDIQVWKMLVTQQKPHHITAISLVKKYNIQEYNRIINSCTNFKDALKIIIKFNTK